VGTPGGTEGLGSIQQGVLENANVDVVGEFIQMIVAQRSYEANSRVVKAADGMSRPSMGSSHDRNCSALRSHVDRAVVRRRVYQ